MITENNNKENMDKDKSKKTTKKKFTKKIVKKDVSPVSDEVVKDSVFFNGIENSFLHVRVGTAEEPASDDQIKSIENSIVNLFEKNKINCIAFVTHHAVCIDIIEKNKASTN